MGNRQTNNHYVHAHCVNGGLGHDHDLHPKVADDQEAVDAVSRQRTLSPGQQQTQKCSSDVRRTRIKPQQLRHLMMSETFFGREEALRMDEDHELPVV